MRSPALCTSSMQQPTQPISNRLCNLSTLDREPQSHTTEDIAEKYATTTTYLMHNHASYQTPVRRRTLPESGLILRTPCSRSTVPCQYRDKLVHLTSHQPLLPVRHQESEEPATSYRHQGRIECLLVHDSMLLVELSGSNASTSTTYTLAVVAG